MYISFWGFVYEWSCARERKLVDMTYMRSTKHGTISSSTKGTIVESLDNIWYVYMVSANKSDVLDTMNFSIYGTELPNYMCFLFFHDMVSTPPIIGKVYIYIYLVI